MFFSLAHKNATDLFFDDSLPKYSDINKHNNSSSNNNSKLESSNLQAPISTNSGPGGGAGDYYIDYFNKPNEERYIKSNLIVNEELSTRSKNKYNSDLFLNYLINFLL